MKRKCRRRNNRRTARVITNPNLSCLDANPRCSATSALDRNIILTSMPSADPCERRVSLSLFFILCLRRHSPQHFWVKLGNTNQRLCCHARLATTLLPILQRMHRHSKERSELRLRQTRLLPRSNDWKRLSGKSTTNPARQVKRILTSPRCRTGSIVALCRLSMDTDLRRYDVGLNFGLLQC